MDARLFVRTSVPHAEKVSAVGGSRIVIAATHVHTVPRCVDISFPTFWHHRRKRSAISLETRVLYIFVGAVLLHLRLKFFGKHHTHFLSHVANGGTKRSGMGITYASQTIHQHDIELTLTKHTIESFALASTNGEGATCIVPMHRYLGVSALLIVVVVELILVEREVTILSWINAQFERIPWFLVGPLHLWTPRNNASRLHVERNDIDGCLFRHGLSTFQLLTCPEINPPLSSRQIVVGDSLSFVHHRAHEESVAKHVFILLVVALTVGIEGKRQSSHQ